MTTPMRPRFASVVFDADSTLASIEGIDWLSTLRSPGIALVIRDLTSRAMSGELSLESIYALRLEAIKPTQHEIALLADAYVAAIEPGAMQLVNELHQAGVNVAIVSGGLRDALLPLAKALGVSADELHAVELLFDDQGNYSALADNQPLSQQNGKPVVVRSLKLPRKSVMIGDGSTDAAVRGETDEFIAYTRVARRELVVASADAEARDFDALSTLLFESDSQAS